MNLLFLDVESGGLNPQRHSLLQVGMAAYINGELQFGTKSLFVREEEYIVTPKAMEVNRLNLSEVYGFGLKPEKLVKAIQDFIVFHFGSIPPTIAGHNVMKLDFQFMKHLFERCNQEWERWVSHRGLCTMSLLITLHQLGKIPASALSSSGAFAHFGIKQERPHDALDDVCATVKLYEACMGLLRA